MLQKTDRCKPVQTGASLLHKCDHTKYGLLKMAVFS